MSSNFQVQPIHPGQFNHLFSWDDAALAKIGAERQTVTSKPGFPCRISLKDAEVGEEVLLLPYDHHQTDSPYQAKGPIFIRKNVPAADLKINEIPLMLDHRLLSLRGYNKAGMMLAAKVGAGQNTKEGIQDLFSNKEVAYIHIHNAGPGCFNCQVIRI